MTQNGRKTLQGTGTEPAGLYPHGLVQPSGGLRFGLDALLLAAFTAQRLLAWPGQRDIFAVELGCGCGAALLGAALACPRVRGLGLEREVALTAAATENIVRLGLSARLAVRCLDVGDAVALRGLPGPDSLQNSANWSGPGGGPLRPRPTQCWPIRPPIGPDGLRRIPCGNGPCALPTGRRWKPCRAAGLLLRHKGHFFCCYDARALGRLCRALHTAGLGLRLALPVRAHPADPALLVLAAAQKGAADDLHLEAPLTLHAGRGPVRATAPRPQSCRRRNGVRLFFTAEAWRQHGTGATTAGADKKGFCRAGRNCCGYAGPVRTEAKGRTARVRRGRRGRSGRPRPGASAPGWTENRIWDKARA